ncbi:unnamed protein product [marine sediment metagenome]|uniref:Uncharacterized protein n=1 Tax=marine sediment metagenome TaxID=412755 RepID=X1MH32_9ZZZZ
MKWFNSKQKLAKIRQKQLKTLRNQRYYQKHRDEILKNRIEHYDLHKK